MPRSERPTSDRATQPDEQIGALVDLLKGPRRIWLHGPVAVGKSTGVAHALALVGSVAGSGDADDPIWIDGVDSPREATTLAEQLRDSSAYPRLRIVSGRAAPPGFIDVVVVRWSPLATDDAGRRLRASAPVDHKTGDGTLRELATQLDGLPCLLAHAAKLLGGARASLLCERFDDDAALRFELGGPWAIEAADLLAALDADSLSAWVEWCALPALLARAQGEDLVRRLDVAARARETGWATIPGGDDADSLATPLLPMRAAIEHPHAEQFAGRVQAFAEGLLHDTTATAPAFLRLLARNARRARLADTEANLLCRLPSPDSTVSDRLHQLLPRLAQTVRLRALIRIANEHRHRGELDATRAALEPLLCDPAIPPTAELLVNAARVAYSAVIALERGRDDEARALLDESLELFVRLHDAHHATIFRAFRDGAELPRAVRPVYVRLRSRCVPNRVRAKRELEAIEGIRDRATIRSPPPPGRSGAGPALFRQSRP